MPPRNPITLATCLGRAVNRLQVAGVDSPRLSAELLLAHVLGCDRLHVLVNPDRGMSSDELGRFEALVSSRARGWPVAYALGEKEFCGRSFHVSPSVLIPRPETERLVELVQGYWQSEHPLHFADVGTGSGALGISLALLFPRSQGLLTDISLPALTVCGQNIVRHHLSSRLCLVCADAASALEPGSLDCIVANPPYISSTRFWGMSSEVRFHEPSRALWAGLRGTEIIHRIIEQAARALRREGRLLVEIGEEQGREVASFCARSRKWSEIGIERDDFGCDRFVRATRV